MRVQLVGSQHDGGKERVACSVRHHAQAQEHITVCTVGRAEGIAQLAAAGFKRLNLSVSLNAARDPLRSSLRPVNRRTPLAELQAALRSEHDFWGPIVKASGFTPEA